MPLTVFDLRKKHQGNQQICKIDANREITKSITRLRTGHFGDMKMTADNTRTYVKFRNCSDKEISLCYIFSCPAMLAILQNIGAYPFGDNLYIENIVEVARAVTKVHGSIKYLVGRNKIVEASVIFRIKL